MFLRTFLFLITLFSFTAGWCQPTLSTVRSIWEARWQRERVAQGIQLRTARFDSKQSVAVLEVDPLMGYQMGIAFHDSLLVPTSAMAEAAGALAAVNGTFFNMKEGGSVCFLMTEDSVRNFTAVTFRDYLHEGAVAIDSLGAVSIIARPDSGWKALKGYRSAMAAGPMLIESGISQTPKEEKFNTNRHPRTAIGITQEGHWLLVVVDGRNAQAAGMSIPELSTLMLALNCQEALNLDGGGSTTLWIRQEAKGRVVNHPSDNRQFDHAGERPVSNILYISGKP